LRKNPYKAEWKHHWKEPEKPFPIRIKWVVIAGDRNIHPINLNDVVFDERDLRNRQVNVKEFLGIHGSPD
jgi:hypothetical protein